MSLRIYDRVVVMHEEVYTPTGRPVKVGFVSGQPIIPVEGTEVMLWAQGNTDQSIIGAGETVPPFPLTWVEFDSTRERLDADGDDEVTGLHRVGRGRSAVLLVTNKVDEGWTVKGMPMCTAGRTGDFLSGSVLIPSIRTARAHLNEQGIVTHIEHALTLEGSTLDAELNSMDSELIRKMEELNAAVTGHMFVDALFACLFANCKNVDLIDEPPRHTTKAVKRKLGQRPTRFKTIKLPGPPSASSGTARCSNSAPAEVPLHLVRGHFKTYTKDKPLFGSRVGTYWWGHHVRGDERNGVSPHSYEVGPPL